MDNKLIHEAAETALALARAGTLELQAVLWGRCANSSRARRPRRGGRTLAEAVEAAARESLDGGSPTARRRRSAPSGGTRRRWAIHPASRPLTTAERRQAQPVSSP